MNLSQMSSPILFWSDAMHTLPIYVHGSFFDLFLVFCYITFLVTIIFKTKENFQSSSSRYHRKFTVINRKRNGDIKKQSGLRDKRQKTRDKKRSKILSRIKHSKYNYCTTAWGLIPTSWELMTASEGTTVDLREESLLFKSTGGTTNKDLTKLWPQEMLKKITSSQSNFGFLSTKKK